MTTTLLWGLTAAFGTALALGVQLGLLAVTLTIVQRRRPDAVPVLLGATALDLFTTIVAFPLPLLLRFVGPSSYMQVQLYANAAFSVCHALAKLILIFGIVKLASTSDVAGEH
jgi:hypothetical protein